MDAFKTAFHLEKNIFMELAFKEFFIELIIQMRFFIIDIVKENDYLSIIFT